MQVTIKGTSPTDTLDEGEVRTVELTPYVRNLIRNGLAVQVPRVIPDPAEAKPVPAKKAHAKKAAAKKAAKAVEEFDTSGDVHPSGTLVSLDSSDQALAKLSPNAREFVQSGDALTDEE